MECGDQVRAAPEDGVTAPAAGAGSGSLLDNSADSDTHMGEGEVVIDYSLLDEPDMGPPLAAPPPTDTLIKERTDYGNKTGSVGSELSAKFEKTRLFSAITDDVFQGGHEPSSKGPVDVSGSEKAKKDLSGPPAQIFPPIYNILRARKLKQMAANRLGATFGVGRGVSVGSGNPAGFGTGDMRAYKVQNYHCAEKGLNVSFSIARPEAGSDRMCCLGCTDEHSFADRMAGEGLPVLVILSDQAFPAVLPAAGALCPIIMRVEDGTISEIVDVFMDRLKAFCSPHGSLPPGSVILLGSLSHLRARGVADYAESLVGAAHRLGSKTGSNVDVVPLVFVPMQGIADGCVIRDLFDLDGWLASAAQPVSTLLGSAREAFWKTVFEEGGERGTQETRTIMLPHNLKNNRKAAYTCEPPICQLPASLSPFDSQKEQKIVLSILREINETYGLGLDENPNLERTMDPIVVHDKGRLVIVGASHMNKVCREIVTDHEVVNLAEPGWVPEPESVSELVGELNRLKVKESDTVVLDLLSNSVYMGSDASGMPAKVEKMKDGRYHLLGDLQICPESVLKRILRDCGQIFEAIKPAKKILMVPFPRYISGKCCPDQNHIENYGIESYLNEILKVSVTVKSAIATVKLVSNFVVYELSESDVIDMAELTNADAPAVWADPVHFRPEVYASIAADLAAIAERVGAGDEELPAKRLRLDSVAPPVVTVPSRARGRPTVPSWLLGRAARTSVLGSGRGRGSVRGGTQAPWRGRGGNRWFRAPSGRRWGGRRY